MELKLKLQEKQSKIKKLPEQLMPTLMSLISEAVAMALEDEILSAHRTNDDKGADPLVVEKCAGVYSPPPLLKKKEGTENDRKIN